MSRKEGLLKAMKDGERGALGFLSANPDIVCWAFLNTGGHSIYVVKEFPFGSRYRADFVLPLSYSGMWEVHLVEIEPPDDPVINKDGTPSQRFNKALSQINDWDEYIRQNPNSFRKDLSDHCMTKDLLKWHKSKRKPCNYTSDYLHGPSTYIQYNYHIVIGSRDMIDNEKRRKMNQLQGRLHIDVCTFGRFLGIADNFDRAAANPKKSIWLTESEE